MVWDIYRGVEPTSKEPELQKVLVVVAFHVIPVFVSGREIEAYALEELSTFLEQLREGGMTDNDPGQGVHVWEGYFNQLLDPHMTGSDSGCEWWDFSNGKWRVPTLEEGLAVLTGENPWVIYADKIDFELSLSGTHCSVCGLPQFVLPHGLCCDNGHGGAPSVEDGP